MLLSSATASLSCGASPEGTIDHPTERKGVFAMKKRLEILYSTAICSGILLLLLVILFAAVLAGHPGEGASLEERAAALGWLRAGQVDAVVGGILFAVGLGLRLWQNRQPRPRRSRRR